MEILQDVNAGPLGSLAEISTGFSFREGFSPSNDGPLVIQLKNINPEGGLMIAELGRGEAGNAKDTHHVVAGNLVFRSRGNRFTATVVPVVPEPLLLAAPLVRIAIKNGSVLPGYLAWCINSKRGQDYLNGVAEGSTVRKLDVQALQAMPVSVPSLERQRVICDLLALRSEERSLAARLQARKEILFDMIITEYSTTKGAKR
jgi:hypothetical protein